MKFLLDVNIHRELGNLLLSSGHQSRHAADVGFATTSDRMILEEAKKKGEVIMTHDLDYGNLLAFSGEMSSSVIIFRTRNIHPVNLHHCILKYWSEIESPLSSGSIVIIEDAAVRIRKLPIVDTD